MKRPNKREFKQVIKECGGNVAAIARAKGVSRETVYQWLRYHNCRDVLHDARQEIRVIANDVIYDRLLSVDRDEAYRAAQFVILHMNNQGGLLPLDVRLYLAGQGISESEAVEQFSTIVRQRAAQGAGA